MNNISKGKVLIKKYYKIISDLKKLKIARTDNAPIGDYGEYLVASKYNLKLLINSSKGSDALSKNGKINYQIKTRRVVSLSKAVQFGVIRNLNKLHFDYLVCVVFDKDINPIVIAKLTRKQVQNYTQYRFSKHQSGHILIIKIDELRKYSWKK